METTITKVQEYRGANLKNVFVMRNGQDSAIVREIMTCKGESNPFISALNDNDSCSERHVWSGKE